MRAALSVAVWALLVSACSERKESCALEAQEEGSYRLRCPDGSSGTFIPPASEGAPAVVEGVARRLGDHDAGGIEVSLEPTFPEGDVYRTITDPEGSYRFEDVDSGTYQLFFHTPAYPKAVRWQQTVLPGTLRLDPVILRPSVHLSRMPVSQLLVAPTEDALLAHEEERGRLIFWDEKVEEVLLLGREVSNPQWLPDGMQVLFLESAQEGTGSGNLILFDRKRGTSESIMSGVSAWEVSADQQTIAIVRQNSLHVWSASTRESTTVVGRGLLDWDFHPHSQVIAAVLAGSRGGTEILLWDSLAVAGSIFERATSNNVQFSPQGDLAVLQTADGLFLWNRAFPSRPERLGSPGTSATISPYGRYVVVHSEGGARLEAYIVATRRRVPLSEARSLDGFDPRNGDLWFTESSTPTRRLKLFDGAQVIEIDSWGSDLSFFSWPLFPEGSESLFYTLRNGAQEHSLRRWRLGLPREVLANGLHGSPELVGDDSHLVLHAGSPQLFDIAAGEFSELRAAGLPRLHQGSHHSGILHYPLGPLYVARVDEVIGPMTILDLQSGEDRVIADEVKQDSCKFSPHGSLYCLNRVSPVEPYGAQLLRWDREAGSLERLCDGVLEFGFANRGARSWFESQAVNGERGPLLWLDDPSQPAPVAIEEGYSKVALTESWIALSIDEGERQGLHISLYPRSLEGLSQ